MLINCPKCGFTQPQDRYCAQCGVDIAAYKAPVAPLGKRLSENYVITGGFSLFILSLTILIILQSNTGVLLGQKISRAINIAKSDKTSESTNMNDNIPETTEVITNKDSIENETNANTVTTAASTSSNSANAAAVETKKTEEKDDKNANTKNSSEAKESKKLFLKIVYVEILKSQLVSLANESRVAGQFNDYGDYATGIFTNQKSKLDQAKILYEVEKIVEPGKIILWHLGPEGSENDPDIGISSSLELTVEDNGKIRGNLGMIRSWKEKNSQGQIFLDKKPYSGGFEITSDATFYFAGGVPHQTAMEQDLNFVRSPPFQILRSEEFKSGISELAIFFSFERK